MLHNEQQISEFKSKSGLARIMKASVYSVQGLKHAWRSEHAFRQELMVVIPALCVAALVPVPILQKLALVFVLAFVLVVELLNSAIEAVVDRISLERHPLSKNAKDLGSAAVFVSVIMAAVTWAAILAPVILRQAPSICCPSADARPAKKCALDQSRAAMQVQRSSARPPFPVRYCRAHCVRHHRGRTGRSDEVGVLRRYRCRFRPRKWRIPSAKRAARSWTLPDFAGMQVVVSGDRFFRVWPRIRNHTG